MSYAKSDEVSIEGSWISYNNGTLNRDIELGPNQSYRVFTHEKHGRFLIGTFSCNETPTLEAALKLDHVPGNVMRKLNKDTEVHVVTQDPEKERTFAGDCDFSFITDDKINVEYGETVQNSVSSANLSVNSQNELATESHFKPVRRPILPDRSKAGVSKPAIPSGVRSKAGTSTRINTSSPSRPAPSQPSATQSSSSSSESSGRPQPPPLSIDTSAAMSRWSQGGGVF